VSFQYCGSRSIKSSMIGTRGWRRNTRPAEASHPVFIVATEGGGIPRRLLDGVGVDRASGPGAAVLGSPLAISSVSGGSLGATVFTALVADKAPHRCGGRLPRNHAGQFVSSRGKADVVVRLSRADARLDAARRFSSSASLPIGFIPDRAKALETGWENAWRTRLRTAEGPDEFFSGGMLKMYADRPDVLLLLPVAFF